MATNDDIRLKLTVSKMNIHRSTKLETIAAQKVVRNLDSFLDPQFSETRNVMLLPSALQNIVFQHWLTRQSPELQRLQKESLSRDDLVKIFEKGMKVFQSLVSCHTLEVGITPLTKNKSFTSLAIEHLLKYLNFIGDKATNLQVLNISECYQHGTELNRTLCEEIGKLRNLRSLNIKHILVNYKNLKAMCKSLKSLTHLSTSIIFNPHFDVSSQREIEDLKIFSNLIVFEPGNSDEKFTINCIQRLPKLQYFGTNLTTNIIEKLLDRCPNQKFALTQMILEARTNKEIHLSFPDVTNLRVLYSTSDDSFVPNSLLKFSKIQNLTLTFFRSADKMIPFLDAYGHGLNSLCINDCFAQFKLSTILDRCPKLESLFLHVVSNLPECSRPDIHSFSTGLKELEWYYHRYGSDNHVPLLLDILSVPTLECVTLRMSCKRFHLEEIETLTAMIASRQILGNLKRLCVFVIDIDWDSYHRVFLALSYFIKSASAFLPHLTEIKTNIISINDQIEMNSEVSSEVATLKTFIEVYEM
ncbi:Hypothetical predicted protein [Cloeon dipterum]|uniref:F-box domain-containing protein n=1 Tax=Cloeon dipterum TaxID=197152 RepID=A0A8S1DT68_9INSE|nr:Hypothetical predicted protein [Cloeon dipterum]